MRHHLAWLPAAFYSARTSEIKLFFLHKHISFRNILISGMTKRKNTWSFSLTPEEATALCSCFSFFRSASSRSFSLLSRCSSSCFCCSHCWNRWKHSTFCCSTQSQGELWKRAYKIHLEVMAELLLVLLRQTLLLLLVMLKKYLLLQLLVLLQLQQTKMVSSTSGWPSLEGTSRTKSNVPVCDSDNRGMNTTATGPGSPPIRRVKHWRGDDGLPTSPLAPVKTTGFE